MMSFETETILSQSTAARLIGLSQPMLSRMVARGLVRGRGMRGKANTLDFDGTAALTLVRRLEVMADPPPPERSLKQLARAVESRDDAFLRRAALVLYSGGADVVRVAYFTALTASELQRFREDPDVFRVSTLDQVRDGIVADLERRYREEQESGEVPES